MSDQTFLKKKQVWCFSTYFAEGFPFAVIRVLSSVFFTDIGMKERYIGYLNFLGIPWNLKFLWGPLLDIFGTKRTWMIVMQVVISLMIACVAGACILLHSHGLNPAPYVYGISISFIILAFFSATNDIAIDGYFMEGIPDKKEQAAYTGYRVFAYRIAVIFVRFALVAVAAFAAKQLGGTDKYLPWAWAFGTGALVMLLVTLFNISALPRFELSRAKASHTVLGVMKDFGRAFASWLDQERVGLVIIFIILYKIGDEILFSMGTPFLMRELHVTKAQYAWLGGFIGAAGAIIGTSLGGIWIKRTGFKKAIWPLTILMNFNIWAYIWLAWLKPTAAGSTGLAIIAAVHCYEQMAAGLGNAVLTVFILRTCKQEFKAGHFAIGSAIMSLFSTFFGGFGGVIVEKMGYLNMFLMAFAVSIPSMLLLFWVPIKSEELLDKK